MLNATRRVATLAQRRIQRFYGTVWSTESERAWRFASAEARIPPEWRTETNFHARGLSMILRNRFPMRALTRAMHAEAEAV